MQSESIRTDVLVIGGGAAGLVAALAARAAGKAVLLACKGPVAAGSPSAYAGGQLAIHLPHPVTQTPDDWAAQRPLTGPAVARALIEEAEAQVQTLAQYGVPLRPSSEGGYRGDAARGGGFAPGAALTSTLVRAAERAGVRIIPRLTVSALALEDRRCGGAIGFTLDGRLLTLRARAVVVATGGAGAIFEHSLGMAGEGYALLLRAGVPLTNLEFVKFFPLGMVGVRYPPHRPQRSFYDLEGLRVINAAGEDIFEKHLGQTIREGLQDLYSRFVATSAIVARERRAGPVLLDLRSVPPRLWDTLRDMGPTGLAQRWSGSPAMWRRLLNERQMETAPISHSFSGGAEVGPNMATAIQGLFAAGEVVDAFLDLGAVPLYEIGPLAWAVTSGGIAGREAARAAEGDHYQRTDLAPTHQPRLERLTNRAGRTPAGTLVRKVKRIMSRSGGPLRNGALLRDGLDRLDAVRSKADHLRVGDYRDLSAALEVENMLLVSEGVLKAASTREESRSEHSREDFPARDDARWLRRIVLSLDEAERLSVGVPP
jgi:succinate dehydrogenase / fumarate reductase, flavoprotein subunit